MKHRDISLGLLLILGCTGVITPSQNNNSGPTLESLESLKFAGTVTVTGGLTPSRAKAGDEVVVSLQLATTRDVAVDVTLALQDSSGKQLYTGAWSSQNLTATAPMKLTESLVVETIDPVGTYSLSVVVSRTGSTRILSQNAKLATFEIYAAPTCTDADGDGSGTGTGCKGPDCNDADSICWAGDCCTLDPATAKVVFTATAPTVDGAADSVWTTAAGGKIAQSTFGQPTGTGTFKTLWTSDALFVLYDIADTTKQVDSPEAYRDDSVELYLDLANNAGTLFDANDFHFLFRRGDAAVWEFVHNSTAGVTVATREMSTGYRLEARIPWSTLGLTPKSGGTIGLDAMLNDDIDGGDLDAQMSWHSPNSGSLTTPAQLGKGIFAGGPICSPSCSGKQCGPDGCGGLCGQCTTSQTCSAAGTCQANTGVAIRSDGMFVVDGKPFFPFGFIANVGDPMRDVQLVGEAGFNFLHCNNVCSPAYFAKAAELGVKIVEEIWWPGPQSTVTSGRDMPALFGWYVADDMNYSGGCSTPKYTPAQVAARSTQIKGYDYPAPQGHPTVGAAVVAPGNGCQITPYVNSVDAISGENYPIGNWGAESSWLTASAEIVRSFVKDIGPGHPKLINTQTFSWPGARYPTAVESRNMNYAALVLGATGLYMYSFSEPNSYIPLAAPELWAELKTQATEIPLMYPMLLDGHRTELATGQADVYASAWTLNGKAMVIAVSTNTSLTKTVALQLPGGVTGPLHPPFTRYLSRMSLANGILSGTIQPREVQIYVTAIWP